MNDINPNNLPPAEFWETHYATKKLGSSGTPSVLLVHFAEMRQPGRALDLGCAHGDDALWLAGRGWQATGVDISETVIARAATRAESLGFADRARFERHDLSQTFPEGAFDLVTAFFLQSPVDFPRPEVLSRASRAVAPGGLLLIVAHASVPPWSWSDPDERFPTAEETFAELTLDTDKWLRTFVGSSEREAKGPDGQEAVVSDSVIALTRRST